MCDKLDTFFGDRFHKRVFLICLLTSVSLIIGSFLTPPLWIIDGSVLMAVGELFAFASLAQIVAAIERGKKAKISKGNMSLEVGENNDNKKENDD